MKHTLTIGITDCSKYDNYSAWIQSVDASINIIKLSYKLDNIDLLESCNGVILTGGEDVYPTIYGKPEYLEILDLSQMDEKRDAFELQIIGQSLQAGKPILGICRGLQIANVYFGGSLVPDIPIVIGSNFHNKIEGKDQRHHVELIEGSLINKITGQQHGEINSAHHQSAQKIGKGLIATGYADNNIVEAIEWKETAKKSWLLLVQWHPERISNDAHFSLPIREAFLKAAGLFD
jgi:putative glutamine amidotransferase